MVFCLKLHAEAPVLGNALLGDVQLGNDLEPGQQERMEGAVQRLHDLVQDAVDAVLDDQGVVLISMWMSEAFLLTAVRMMLFSSLMTESSSSVMLSMVTTSSSSTIVGRLLQGEGLGLVAQHLGVGVAFFEEFFQLVAVGEEGHDLFLGEILDHADLVEVLRDRAWPRRWCRRSPPGGRRGS